MLPVNTSYVSCIQEGEKKPPINYEDRFMIKNDHGVVCYPTLDLDLIEKWQKMNLNKPDPADLIWVKMDNRSVVGCDFVLDEKVDLSLVNIFLHFPSTRFPLPDFLLYPDKFAEGAGIKIFSTSRPFMVATDLQ